VYLTSFSCIGIGGFVGMIQLFCWIPNKVLKSILIILFVLACIWNSPIILLVAAFGYVPEHSVEKNGERYIASVYAFLDVRVEYQKEISFCFKGYEVEWEEDYGEGGFDPFTTEMEHTPISTTDKKKQKVESPKKEEIEQKTETIELEKQNQQSIQEAEIAYEKWEDDKKGKKICIMDYAMGKEAIQIFQTEDGGENWVLTLETENQALWVHYHSSFWFYTDQVGFIYDPGRDGVSDAKASLLLTLDGRKEF